MVSPRLRQEPPPPPSISGPDHPPPSAGLSGRARPPRPAPSRGGAASDAHQTVPPSSGQGVLLCGWGAEPTVSEAEARPSAADDGSAARHLGSSTARLPGPEAAGTSAEAVSGSAPPPPSGSGGWAWLRQRVRWEMAEPPRRGPRPRKQGSRAAPGRGGARGQRGGRPVRRVSCP